MLANERERRKKRLHRTKKFTAQLCCRGIRVNEIAGKSCDTLIQQQVEIDQSVGANFSELNVKKSEKK